MLKLHQCGLRFIDSVTAWRALGLSALSSWSPHGLLHLARSRFVWLMGLVLLIEVCHWHFFKSFMAVSFTCALVCALVADAFGVWAVNFSARDSVRLDVREN